MDWTVALWIVLMGVLFVLAPLGCSDIQAKILYVIVLAVCVVSVALRGVRGVFGKDDA